MSLNYTLPKTDALFVFPNTDPLTIEMALFLDAPLWDHFRQEFGQSTNSSPRLVECKEVRKEDWVQARIGRRRSWSPSASH